MELRNYYRAAMLLGAMSALAGTTDLFGEPKEAISKAGPRKYHPWDCVQLTKAERKGKTFEEMQMIRKQKFEKEVDDEIQSRR